MIRPHYVPLYQSICTSEKLADLPDDACRLFYVLLLTHMDSWGRCKASPRTLKNLVWPDLGKSTEETARVLDHLEHVKLIVRYEVDGEPFLCDPAWEEFAGRVGTKEKRGRPIYPDPPEGKPRRRRNPQSTLGDTPPYEGGPKEELPRAHADAQARLPIRSDPIRSDPRGESASRAADGPPLHTHKARRIPDTAHAQFLEFWCQEFRRATGAVYAVRGGKDGALVKGMLQALRGDEGELRRRATALLTDPPAWIASRGSAIDLGTLSTCLNQIASQGHISEMTEIDRRIAASKMNGSAT